MERRTNLRDSDSTEQQDSCGKDSRKDRSPQGPGSQAGEARCHLEVQEAKDRDSHRCWQGAGVGVELCRVRKGAGAEPWGLKIR